MWWWGPGVYTDNLTYFIIASSSTQENELITQFITQTWEGFIKMWDQMKNYIIFCSLFSSLLISPLTGRASKLSNPTHIYSPKSIILCVCVGGGEGGWNALNLDVKILSHLRIYACNLCRFQSPKSEFIPSPSEHQHYSTHGSSEKGAEVQFWFSFPLSKVEEAGFQS